MIKPEYIIVHHTASKLTGTNHQLPAVDEYHKNKNWGTASNPDYATKSSLGFYATYHDFIEADGSETQLRGWTELGWHAGYMNDKAIGICMAGRFDQGYDAYPSKLAIDTLTNRLKALTGLFKIPVINIYPHRAFAKKTCYGNNLSDDWARNLLTNHNEIILITEYQGKVGLLFLGGFTGGLLFAPTMDALKEMCKVYGKSYTLDSAGNIEVERRL